MPDIVCRIVEICVFKMVENEPIYLMLKRSDNDKVYPGIWQIVTGFIEPRERAVEAARRELKEETKIVPRKFWVVPHVNSFFVPAEDTVHLTTFFAAEVSASEPPTLSEEHQSFRWERYKEAWETLVWPGQRKGLEIVHEYIVGSRQTSRLVELKPVEA